MVEKLALLTEDDTRLIQEVLDAVKNNRINTPSRSSTETSWSDAEDHQAPERYVFRVPVEGISARVSFQPGMKICNVWRINPDGGGLEIVSGVNRLVHNISTNAAVGGEFFVGERDKFGKFVMDYHCC